ncbi:MAG: winged helix-turn-helix transcriptional regulator [Oscillospiraceae bacterium]|jgi:DNA-binding MarR family transcriptional regulator|nr:winged helix-turn-helix transcriptional regulator [Oscillospiraceae bacterium]
MAHELSEALQDFNHNFKALTDVYHTIAKKLSLSDSEFDVLYALYILGEGCTQKAICDYAWVSKQTIHSAVRKLEQQGALRLERGQGREARVFLTDAGRKLVDAKIPPVVAAEEKAIQDTDGYIRFVMKGVIEEFTDSLRQSAEDL